MKQKIVFFICCIISGLVLYCCDYTKYSYDDNSFYYAKASSFPVKLYTIDRSSMNRAESEMVASLQGILAKGSNENVYIKPGVGIYADLLKHFEDSGAEIVEGLNVEQLLNHFKDKISGYLIWTDGDPDSLNNAFSLAGIKKGLVVESSLISMVQESGLELIEDMRGSKSVEVYRQYKDSFNKKVVVELDPGISCCLRDYAVLADAFVFFDPKAIFRSEVYSNMYPDSAVMGWGNAENGEDQFVGPSSKSGLHYIAANFAYNLSVLSSEKAEEIASYKDGNSSENLKLKENVHTVCFVMSDGDNLQWNLNGYMNDEKWYGYSDRGSFPMGWGVAPSMYELAPSALNYLYSKASVNDGFVLYTGTGYMYPSHYPFVSLASNLQNLDDYLGKLDLSIVQIIDFNVFSNILLWHKYMTLKNLEGLFYLEYTNHAKHKGKIKWVNDKPVITPRYMLWEGLDGCDNDSVVNSINNGSRNVYSEDSYSLVVVHAWSKYMTDVEDVISRFNPDVRIVTPEDFVKLIKLSR
jgi:hypothetical protein